MHRAKIMPPPALLLWALVAGCRICRVDSFSFSPMGIGIRRAPCSAATFYASTRSSISNRFHGRSPLALPFVKSMAAMASGASGESSTTVASSTEGMVEYPSASDGEALQSLFSKQCSEGLMTEDDLRNVPAIKDMLRQGDLLSSELSEIWKAAPKFPQVVDLGEEEEPLVDKIDVDSFIQVYRDIDDLFEDEEEEEEEEEVESKTVTEDAKAEVDNTAAVISVGEADEEEVGEDLKQTFATLGDNKSLSFLQLRQWEEIVSMIEEEGDLTEEELVSLWEDSLGVEGTGGDMDLAGFVKFNSNLDDLFELEDEDEEEGPEEEETVTLEAAEIGVEAPAPPPAPRPIITEEDLPPGVLFSQLANENYLVSKEDLPRWGELADWLKEGELTIGELDALYNNAAKAPGTKDMLDEDGFFGLYDEIDKLFEDVDDEEEDIATETPAQRELKEELLEIIEDISALSAEEGLQLCGLDCSELEQERVLEVVSELEGEPYNQVVVVSAATGDGAIKKEQLIGTWELLYSSSSTMKYNEGLSGLAGGLTSFGGLKQRLTGTKYLSDVEYTETLVGKFGGQEADVRITGDWDLRTEVSLFTGKPSNVLSVLPDKVFYASRSDKADHWKSLGPMNLLVLSYLDEDLRIMRGNTSTDTLFIWRRNK